MVPHDVDPVRAVVFDLYGTVVDIETDEESREFWERLARHLEAQGIRTAAAPLRARYRQLCEAAAREGSEGFILEEIFERFSQGLGMEARSDRGAPFAETFRSLSIKSLAVRPYAKPLLAELARSGCKAALVSNTEAIFTRFDLRRCGLANSFDAIVLSSEAGLKKPDARIFHLALRRLDEDEVHAVFVGDNPVEDIQGAQHAGLRSLFVNPEGPDFVAEQLLPTPRVIGVFPSLDSIERGLRDLGWENSGSLLMSRRLAP